MNSAKTAPVLEAEDGVRFTGARPEGLFGICGGALFEAFQDGPGGFFAGAKEMESALPGADDVGVAGGAALEEVGPAAREVMAGESAEGLAGAKPEEGFGARESAAKGFEVGVVVVVLVERCCIESFSINQEAPPLAVAPVLDLADRAVGSESGEPVEGFGPASYAAEAVETAEALVEPASEDPAMSQPGPPGFPAAGLVVDHQSEGLFH